MHIRRLMLPAIYLRIRNLLKCCQRQRQNLEHTRKMQRLQRRKRSRSAKARKGGARRSGKKERGDRDEAKEKSMRSRRETCQLPSISRQQEGHRATQ